MPAAFLGHGSPMNALEHNGYTEAWRAFGSSVPRPRAILVHFGPLVHQCERPHRDGQAQDDPRLLRFSRRAVRGGVSGPGRSRPGAPDRRRRRTHLGRRGPGQLGHRPRHLVGARPRLPRSRYPRAAVVHQRPGVLRLPPRARGEARPAALPRCADHRQRERGPQPAPRRLEPTRGRVRLGPPVRQCRPGAHDDLTRRCAGAEGPRRLSRRRADRGALPPAPLHRRVGGGGQLDR